MSAVVKTPHHLDMDGNRIANLDDPTSDSEAATKGYVDRAIAAALATLRPTVADKPSVLPQAAPTVSKGA